MIRTIIETNHGVQIHEYAQITIAVYADDIMIAAESEENLKATTLGSNRKKLRVDMGLIINESKTKYMILSRKAHNQTEN